MDLKQFRAAYPQYNDLPDQDLADRLYQRHYSDLPRPEFDSQIGLTTIASEASRLPLMPDESNASSMIFRDDPDLSRIQPQAPRSTPVDIPARTQARLSQLVDQDSFAQKLDAKPPVDNRETVSAPSIPGPAIPALSAMQGLFRLGEKGARVEQVAKRLPGNIKTSIGAQTTQMVAGGGQAINEMTASAAEREARGEDPFQFGAKPTPAQIKKSLELARKARGDAREFAGIASAARTGAQEAIPKDAGKIERALQTGISSAAVAMPAVLAAGPIGGSAVLGAGAAGARYSELREAGVDEAAAARSGALLGSLEGLTEFLPGSTMVKRVPGFWKHVTEFMVREIPGENITTIAEMVDDYGQGLRDDITLDELMTAVEDTTLATVAGGSAQISAGHLLQKVSERANELAEFRALETMTKEPEVMGPPKPKKQMDMRAAGGAPQMLEEGVFPKGHKPPVKTPVSTGVLSPVEELSLLESVQANTATPEQAAQAVSKGYASLTETNQPLLLPEGRTRLTQLKEEGPGDAQSAVAPDVLPGVQPAGGGQVPGVPDPETPAADGAAAGEALAADRGTSQPEVAIERPAETESAKSERLFGQLEQDVRETIADLETAQLNPAERMKVRRDLTKIRPLLDEITQARAAGGTPEQARAFYSRLADVSDVDIAPMELKGHEKSTRGQNRTWAAKQAAIAERAVRDGKVHGQPVQVNTQPTEAQKEAGNYKKAHLRFHGMQIAIENLKGTTRTGKSANGHTWERRMGAHYGYVKKSEGADGDQVDVYLGERPKSTRVFVIDQLRPDGKTFDEHKVVMAVDSKDEAEALYRKHYPQNWKGMGAITELPVERFRDWLKSGDTKQPLAWRRAVKRSTKRAQAEHDSLLEFISKVKLSGTSSAGVNLDDLVSEGLDPADLKKALGHGINRPFTKGGASLDQMAEALSESGFPVLNDKGQYDKNVLLDRITEELRGQKHFSTAAKGYEDRFQELIEKYERPLEEEFKRRGDESLDDAIERANAALEAAIAERDQTEAAIEEREREPGEDDEGPLFHKKGGNQGDLFASSESEAKVIATRNALKKLEAQKDKQRNTGQDSTETGRRDDMFSQAIKQRELEEAAKPKAGETYWKGDRARYTGKTQNLHGGLFYELELLEGHRKGDTVVTVHPPKTVIDQVGERKTSYQMMVPKSQMSLPLVRRAMTTIRQNAGADVELRPVGELKVSGKNLRGADAVAATVSDIVLEPQEMLLFVGLDKDRLPIAVLQHSIGTQGSASAKLGLALGAMLTVPGVETIYMVHNHPSNEISPSQEDVKLSKAAYDLLKNTKANFAGSIVMGRERGRYKLEIDSSEYAREYEVVETDERVPLMRRSFVREIVPQKLEKVGGPTGAIEMVKRYGTGIYLSDYKYNLLKFIPLSEKEMRSVGTKTSGGDSLAERLLRSVHETNASGMMIGFKDQPLHRAAAENMIAFGQRASVDVLDIIEGGSSLMESLGGKDEFQKRYFMEMLPLFHKKPARGRNLLIQHNLSGQNLLHAVKMGGIPVPSLSIVKKDHASTSFGEVTLLGPREMADPRGYAKPKVYGADIYSPRYPTVHYTFAKEAMKRLEEMLKPYSEKLGVRGYFGEDELSEGPRTFENSPLVMAMFLDKRGIETKIKADEKSYPESAFRREMRKRDIDDEFNEYAADLFYSFVPAERLFSGTDNYGRRRYRPHTLANVVSSLKKELRGGEGFNYGVGSLRSRFTPQFRSVKAILENEHHLVTKEDFDKLKEEINAEFWAIAEQLRPAYKYQSRNDLGFGDTVISMLEDTAKGGLDRQLKEYGFNEISQELRGEIARYLGKLRNFPTEYFEAKILREVDLAEFKIAVVPADTTKAVLDALKARGVKIHTYKRNDDADRRRVIKEASEASEDVLFHKSDDEDGGQEVFYSNLLRVIETSKQAKATPDQWLGIIANTPGVKKEEVQWTGIEDWLKQQTGTLTREQVSEFIEANQIRVTEKNYLEGKRGHETPLEARIEDRKTQLQYLGWYANIEEGVDVEGNAILEVTYLTNQQEEEFIFDDELGWVEEDNVHSRPPLSIQELVKDLVDAVRQLNARGHEEVGTKYENFTLPGGKDYRELLMTLPTKETTELPPGFELKENQNKDAAAKAGAQWIVVGPGNDPVENRYGSGRTPAEAMETYNRHHGRGFRSSHFDTMNVLAHVRFKERIASDGKRVLFIEEIQSDWHQAGRKQGYNEKNKTRASIQEDLSKAEQALRDVLVRYDNLGYEFVTEALRDISREDNWRAAWPEIKDEAHAAVVDHWVQTIKDFNAFPRLVPNAPFKTTWPELAFKRMVLWATENGFDRIAWTTGLQQAERYNLAKHIKEIWITDNTSGGATPASLDGPFEGGVVHMRLHTGKFFEQHVRSKEMLDDMIGVALADKLLAAEPKRASEAGLGVRRRELTGLDVMVGGEGMRGFYDKILPETVSKLVKKWGGKVSTTSVAMATEEQYQEDLELLRELESLPDDPTRFARVHSVDVTPAMREAAMAGLPLFRQTGGRGTARDHVEAVARNVMSRFAVRSGLRVVDAFRGLPSEVRRRAQMNGATGQEDAFYDPPTSTMYLIANNVDSIEDVEGLVLHEQVVHFGIRDMLGTDERNTIMDGIARDLEAQVREKAQSYGLRFSDQHERRIAAEELVAEMAETYLKGDTLSDKAKRWLDRVIEALRAALAKMGLVRKTFDQKFVASLLTDLHRHVSTGEAVYAEALRSNPGQLAFHQARTEHPTALLEGADPAEEDRFLEKATAFHRPDYVKNLLRWFGDSKVVDKNDNPRIVYHGTDARFTRFDEGLLGSASDSSDAREGFWFTASEARARQARRDAMNASGVNNAPEPMAVYLRIVNPFVVQTPLRDYEPEDSAALIRQAKKDGHDGVIFESGEDGAPDYVVFKPQQIKSVHNRGTFSPRSPDIMFHKKSMLGVFRRRNAVQNGTFDMTEGSKTSRVWNALVFKFQDRLYDLLRLQDQAKVFRSIAQIPDSMDAYLKETLFHGRVEERIAEYEKQFIEPMIEKIKGSGFTWQQVEEFLYARHAPEANARLLAINAGNPRFNSGMTDEEAAQIMKDLAAAGDVSKLHDLGTLIDQMTKWHRDLLVAEGLEDQAVIQDWEATYKHYVPLKGWAHNPELSEMPKRGKGFDTGGKSSKDRTGRTSRAGNLLANIVAEAQMGMIRAEKARVGRALLEFVKQNPAPRLYEVNAVEYQRYIDKGTGLVRQGPNPLFKLADNVLRVRVDGKDEHIVFSPTDPQMIRLVSAMKNLSAVEMNALLTFMHGINRWLSMANTSLNLEFVISNAFRDVQTAMVNIEATDAKKLRGKILKAAPHAWRGIRLGEMGKPHPWATHWERYKKVGAKVGWIQHYESPVKLEKELIDKLNRDGVIAQLGDGIGAVFKWIERQNLAVENAIRLSTFKTAIDAGIKEERAAQIAKNLTVNFNKRGDLGPVMNSMYLFFNASIQGTAILARTAKNKRARRIMYGIVALGIAADILNRMYAGDDEDKGNRYDKIEDYKKERNIIVMLPKDRRVPMPSGDEIDHVMLPMPYGYNFFYYFGTKIGGYLDYYTFGNKEELKPTEDAVRLAATFLGAYNPIGNSPTFEQFLAPTALDPFIQLSQNKNWDGRPIMPPQPQYDIAAPDSQRFYKSASAASRSLTNFLNDKTGGTPITPGAIDISPETLDHLIGFALGGAGRFASNTVNTAHDLTVKPDDLELFEVPMVRRLVGQTGDRQRAETFYRRFEETSYARAEIEQLKEMRRDSDDPVVKAEIAERTMFVEKRYPIAAKMVPEAIRAEKQLRIFRKQRRVYEEREGQMLESDRKARLEEINGRIEAVMQRFNREWNEVMDAQRAPAETRDLIGKIGPIIDGKKRGEAIQALRESGLPAFADLVASLPRNPRPTVLQVYQSELGA